MPYYKGAVRQRGRGLGVAAYAVGRTAIPIIKKYILPTAKRLGKIALTHAAPELIEVATGRSKTKDALKRVATIHRQNTARRRKKHHEEESKHHHTQRST